jgi:integrase
MGMVGVRAASKTTIEITFQLAGKRHRERLQLIPTPSNLKKAQRHRDAIIEAIDAGVFDYATTFPDSKHALKPVTLTLERYLAEWLSAKRPTLKASTIAGYDKIIGQIIAQFGNVQLHQLTRRMVREWVAGMECSTKRISNILSPLRSALQDAVYDDLIKVNPLYGWNYKKNEPPREKRIDPFTAEEQAILLKQASNQASLWITFAMWTGLRTSEQIALQWGDIDWNRGVMQISRAKTQDAKQAETPKTTSGIREVKLLPPALDALTHQKKYTFLADGPVFVNPRTQQAWTGDQPIRRTLWIPLLKKAGIRYRSPYQTRHTYASMMLSAGEPLAWVSKQLGHSDVLVTARTYATWIPDARPEAGDAAVKLFGKG